MTEVQKISGQGPSAPEPRKPVEHDKFQKEMDKVGETDTEQQKKRKHREQVRAEKAAEAETKEPTKEELLVKEINLPAGVGPHKVGGTVQPASHPVEKKEGLHAAPSREKKEVHVEPSGKKPAVSFEEASSFAAPQIPEAPKRESLPKPHEAPKVEAPAMQPKKPTVKMEAQTTGMAPQSLQPLPGVPAGPMLQISQPPHPGILQLPPAIADMFERMAGVMTVMQSSNVKETTIHLTNDKMKGSIFFGAQIIISEHRSAPREFNIQFVGSPQAVEAFQAKLPMIYHNFQTGFDFKVHRLEVALNRDEKVKKVMDAGKEREEKGSS